MRGGQIVALLCSILLLLPGGCFLWVGIFGVWRDDPGPSLPLLSVAAVILALVGLLFWVAIRRQPPSDISGSPQTHENPKP
jgi:membrane protein implicated in regulation of membrane protease activity